MISLTFPDGSVHQFDAGTTGRDIAESISKSLAKKAVAIVLDGELCDISDPIRPRAEIRIVTREDPRCAGTDPPRCAHVMAEAVQELWPGTQVTIGPVIENGFYYDFKRESPFTPEDLPMIEKKMREIISATSPSPTKSGPATRPSAIRGHGRGLQGRTGRRDPRRAGPENLLSGRLV